MASETRPISSIAIRTETKSRVQVLVMEKHSKIFKFRDIGMPQAMHVHTVTYDACVYTIWFCDRCELSGQSYRMPHYTAVRESGRAANEGHGLCKRHCKWLSYSKPCKKKPMDKRRKDDSRNYCSSMLCQSATWPELGGHGR